MKKYEFTRIKVKAKFTHRETEEHREVISARAAEGWRYVGYIPVIVTDYGGLIEIDLIFEKDE